MEILLKTLTFSLETGQKEVQITRKGADEDSRLISDISLTYATKMEPFAVIFMKKGNLFLYILSFCTLEGYIVFFSAGVDNCCVYRLNGPKHHQIYQDKLFTL